MSRRWLAALVLVGFVTVAVAVAPGASADPVADKKRQAQRVARQLDSLQDKAEQLAEEYNDARLSLSDLDAELADTSARLRDNEKQTAAVRARVATWALSAYAHAAQSDSLFAAVEDDSAVAFEGYSTLAVGADSSLADELRQWHQDGALLRADLATRMGQQAELRDVIEARKRAAERAVASQESTLAETNSELRALIDQERVRAAEAERQRVQAAIEARRAAAAAAASSPKRSAGNGTPRHVPPPPSAGALGAVEQAKSQVGVRYRWGQDDPASGFDCSGLTSWAWARAGVSLPHSSRAQYAALAKVDPEDLQPGDLVFFGSPIHHVGLYIGGGQMVHAPHSGANVRVDTIYRNNLRGGARVT
jgi:peptidoglycan DL-endopeptidase CwlO